MQHQKSLTIGKVTELLFSRQALNFLCISWQSKKCLQKPELHNQFVKFLKPSKFVTATVDFEIKDSVTTYVCFYIQHTN